jgi:hypothetical protein
LDRLGLRRSFSGWFCIVGVLICSPTVSRAMSGVAHG